MNLTLFERFLNVCTFKHVSMKDTKTLKWTFEEDEIFFDHHTSYTNEALFERLGHYNDGFKLKLAQDDQGQPQVKIEENKKHEVAKLVKTQKVNELHFFDNDSQLKENDDMKRVELSVLEFDWIFHGKEAKTFIKKLANSHDDTIFELYTVKVLINFLWNKFFYKIRNRIFFPFLVYVIFFLVYVTYIYEQK
jgi:hypothetical protein